MQYINNLISIPMVPYILCYLFVCQVSHLYIHDKVAITYILDSLIYLTNMILYVMYYTTPHTVLRLYLTSLIGPIVYHNIKMPKFVAIHHILSSSFILWFLSDDGYEVERILTCIYCTFTMGMDVPEFLLMAEKRLGHDTPEVRRCLTYVRYFDLFFKIIGNILVLYLINAYELDTYSEYSVVASNILIITMFIIQIRANSHITM